MLALYHLLAGLAIGLINESWQMRLLSSIGWAAVALSIPWLRLKGYSYFVLFVSLTVYVFALASATAFLTSLL